LQTESAASDRKCCVADTDTSAQVIGLQAVKEILAILVRRLPLGATITVAKKYFLLRSTHLEPEPRWCPMRLTLRTMLAYMDDILEPADREEIARKIEESEFARNLMKSIRDSMQKSRLGAPKLNQKGLGLDANTVAEYLDYTLSAERVPDFERVCLESEIHMAEVSACHQVLAMVLSQPAEVDPAMKRRMYKIAEQAAVSPPAPRTHDTPIPVAENGAPPPPTEEVRIAPPRHRPEVPAYLRERNTRSMWRTVLAAVLLLALLGGAITMALGPLDHNNPVLRMLGLAKPPQQEVARGDAPADAPPDQVQPEPDAKLNPNSTETPAIEVNETEVNAPAVAPMPITPMPEVPPTAPMPEGSAAQSAPPASLPPGQGPVPTLPSNTGVPLLPAEGGVPPIPMPTGDNATTPPVRPDEVMPVDPSAKPAPGSINPSGVPPVPMPPESVPPEPLLPAADLPLGRFIAANGVVLLRLDANSGQWDRVSSNAPLAAGDKLLVLPTYRPTITLSTGLTLQLCSETMIELEAANAGGVPGIKLFFGKIVAMTTGYPGAQLRLELGPAKGIVTFIDADATLGAEVRLFHPFGIDPEKVHPQMSADLYDVSGELLWTSSGGAATKLTALQRLPLVANAADSQPVGTAATIPALPPWIDRETLTSSQASASAKLAEDLADEKRPLLQTLREFAESQRIEHRLLAAQSLALLDQFDPMIDGLNDDRNRAYWGNLIATARNSLTRGPTTAVRLREAFEQRRGQSNGVQLYRMLGGFTKDQLTNDGWAAELVKYLDDDNLDFRILAITNLIEITGNPRSYRPEEKNATNRRSSVNRWKEELRAGRIVPKEPTTAK
jgi:hypothetical protein